MKSRIWCWYSEHYTLTRIVPIKNDEMIYVWIDMFTSIEILSRTISLSCFFNLLHIQYHKFTANNHGSVKYLCILFWIKVSFTALLLWFVLSTTDQSVTTTLLPWTSDVYILLQISEVFVHYTLNHCSICAFCLSSITLSTFILHQCSMCILPWDTVVSMHPALGHCNIYAVCLGSV